MKILITTLITLLISVSSFSQTKLIAHKSHSGKSGSFHNAMKYFSADLISSDFGLDPMYEDINILDLKAIKKYQYTKLDTLKYLSDSITVMFTSIYFQSTNDTIKLDKEYTIDTLYNHPLYSKKNALDSIKETLKNGHFKNNIDSVIFLGYDTLKKIRLPKNKKKSISPASLQNTNSPLNIKIIGLCIIFIIALLIGFIYKKVNDKKRTFEKI